jgi:lipopolysaccharide export system ATP-binding protein
MTELNDRSTLVVKGLQKSYGKRLVVRDVSLDVECGEVVGLLGPNGAGKTTSFYMIVGLVPSDAGSISINGTDITSLPIHRRAVLGLSYLPQEASVFRKLTVEENIRAVLELQKVNGKSLTKTEISDRLDTLLADLQIEKLRENPALSLSGGEHWRPTRASCCSTNRLPASIRSP